MLTVHKLYLLYYILRAAAPHGRLPHTHKETKQHTVKVQAWSSLELHCCRSSFSASKAPLWEKRDRCSTLSLVLLATQ